MTKYIEIKLSFIDESTEECVIEKVKRMNYDLEPQALVCWDNVLECSEHPELLMAATYNHVDESNNTTILKTHHRASLSTKYEQRPTRHLNVN
jgi:hypothetical protein